MKKNTVIILFLALFSGICSAQGPKRPDISDWFSVPESGSYTYREEMVEGGDLCKLLTRIYLPEGDGPWPVVVTRTPYVYMGRGDTNMIGREYAKRGIGYIQQDCRGKGGSDGFFSPNIYEREDGIALYKWLQKQEWCGDIGIFGTSYTALTGWIVADKLPEKVKGLYLSHYGVDRHISCYRSGLFREDIMSGWVIDNASEPIIRPKKKEGVGVGENYYDFYLYRPQVKADEAILGQRLEYYRMWISHTDYVDPYWNTGVWGDLKKIPALVNVPVTIVAGQFDHHEEGTILGYERLSPNVKKRSRLILGSWNHSFQVTPTHVPTEHAKDFDVNKDQFEWFYSLLVRKQEPKHEIKVYDIEEDKWLELDHWPIKPTREKKMYLSTQKLGGKDNVLALRDKKADKGVLSYDYDPNDPIVVTGGETIFTSIAKRGCQRQPAPGYRPDVLSFISAPLTQDLTIAGNVTLKLRVSTDVDDTAFAFTLSEVMPNGTTYNMRTSIATLAFRNDPLGPRQTYKAGKEVDVDIVSLPIVWTVKKGNFLRIDVKSSNFPEYAVHPNVAGVWSLQAETRVAHQNVFVGGKKGSVLILPLL